MENHKVHRAAVMVVGAVLGLSVAACGTATTPGVDGTAATTAHTGSAPQVFVERAAVVAEAVRRAGVPTPPAGPLLLSPWAPELGFDTDAQKLAWEAGRVTVGPRVPRDQVGESRMVLPDGSSRPVDVMDPRKAVQRAIEGGKGDCADISPDQCQIVLTGAEMTSVRVKTTEGDATVPAWSFTAPGMSRPVVVVATGEGALVRPPRPDPLPGLPDPDPVLNPADSLEAVAGSTITVRIGSGACDGDLTARAVEHEDLVIVGGTHTPMPPGTVCTSQYLSTPMEITLAKALGDRVVIDVVSGTPRFLGVPFM
jgi:hypothetical protein